MNFQMRNNLSFGETFKRLYNEGGIARFYSGLPYALVSSPISRFGDTAANEGIKAYFEGTVRANLSISFSWSARRMCALVRWLAEKTRRVSSASEGLFAVVSLVAVVSSEQERGLSELVRGSGEWQVVEESCNVES
jgi:hypothetical protein